MKVDKEYAYMDNLAIQANTDKASSFHDYTRIYSKYFKGLRRKKIKFLEIGIYEGNSVKLWENYFPNAELHFIDVTAENIRYTSPRSLYHFLDQEDIKAMHNFAQSIGGDFDVIIDDGGHTMNQQINSFIALFPFVKSGGFYAIEDLHTSYWTPYGGRASTKPHNPEEKTTVDFLKELIDSVNGIGAKSAKASFDLTPEDVMKTLTSWEKEIYSMHFYGSVCIIIKR